MCLWGLKGLFHNHLRAAARQDFESPAWQKKHDFSENEGAITSTRSGLLSTLTVPGASLHYIGKEGQQIHDMCFNLWNFSLSEYTFVHIRWEMQSLEKAQPHRDIHYILRGKVKPPRWSLNAGGGDGRKMNGWMWWGGLWWAPPEDRI